MRILVVLATLVVGYADARDTPPSASEVTMARTKLNPQVAAMKENTWLKLPTPDVRPIARSSSPWMPYVPEAGVAILWGCSHAGYHNDVWTYDLSSNLWKEMLKTEPSAAEDPDVLKYKDGLLMTRLERPLSAHQWGRMDYDPDRQVLWHVGGWWQGVATHAEYYKKLEREIRQEGDASKKSLLKKTPILWRYSLKTNRWDWIYTEDPTGSLRNQSYTQGYIRYFPPLRRLVMTPAIVQPNEEREKFKMYDPATNTWEPLNVTWKPMDEGLSRYWVYGYSPIVYNAKLKAFVLVLSGGGTWLLDPVAKTMQQVVSKDKTPPGNLDGPVGSYVHDSASGTTLGIFADMQVYLAGENLKKRGFPADRTLVLALDVEKHEWVVQPNPTDGILPPVESMRMVHHYYDPVHNATLIYRGPYNGRATETWVYRYKRLEQ